MHVINISVIVILLLLIPSPALAWGPAAHIEFGLAALGDLALLAPAIAELLRRFPRDFLYGSIAADITIGKNLSPYKLHCHNWQVGTSVLDLAEDDSTRAFAWGYLAHLAADIVAHNYFVPYKIVQHFRNRRAAHAYWEIRFDTHMRKETWDVARSLSTRAFGAHDRHLRKILTGPLFSFRVNKQIFNSMVLFSQVLRWKRTVDAYARSSKRLLTTEEVEEMHRLSLERVMDLLSRGLDSDCLSCDPTGHRNILIARDIRKRLRLLYRQTKLIEPDDIGERFRPLFRQAMDSKLSLPSMQDLSLPGRTTTARAPGRGLLSRKKTYRKPKAPKTKVGLRRRAQRLLGKKEPQTKRVKRKKSRSSGRKRARALFVRARDQVMGRQGRTGKKKKK